MSLLKNRKQLPLIEKIQHKVDISKLQQHCVDNNYTNYDIFNDVNYSTANKNQAFLVANQFSKNSFFKEDSAPALEGNLYKLLYLTELDESKITTEQGQLQKSGQSIFSRMRRLKKDSPSYQPEADELNYVVKNKHLQGEFLNIVELFKAQVTRVRLAVLMPGFFIKPHIDYDPSYITRYHIPIFTEPDVIFGVEKNQQKIEQHLCADGSIYFINTGYKHWVRNNSNLPRLHMIIDTHGQDDLVFA